MADLVVVLGVIVFFAICAPVRVRLRLDHRPRSGTREWHRRDAER